MAQIGVFYFPLGRTVWTDRDAWTRWPQQYAQGMCGTPIITSVGQARGGRPVTLRITGVTRRDVEGIRAMAEGAALQVFDLSIPEDGVNTQAVFRMEDGGSAVTAVPVMDVDEKSIPPDLPAFTLTVKMRIVGV